jgi:hypothetical protein
MGFNRRKMEDQRRQAAEKAAAARRAADSQVLEDAERLIARAQLPHQWTSHRPVASPEGWVFGRPGNRQALTLKATTTRKLSRSVARVVLPDLRLVV